MIDLGKHFGITDCFLCGNESTLDFNALYHGSWYRAPLCFDCMTKYDSDAHVLLAVLSKGNELHDKQEAEKRNNV